MARGTSVPRRRGRTQAGERAASGAEPTLVFTGTVRELGAATMPDLPHAGALAIVRVDHVVSAPAPLRGLAGQDVTLARGDRTRWAVGDQFTFDTAPWVFGESVALRVLRTSAIAAPHRDAHAAPRAHADRVLQKHVSDADVILSGRVVDVRAAPEEEPPGPTRETRPRAGGPVAHARAVAAPPPRRPISEHDPRWRAATIAVDDVAKGRHGPAQAVVRFPASRDVAWWRVPKLKPGDEGVWLLHRTEPPQRATGGVRAKRTLRAKGRPAAPPAEYQLVHPEDFQPRSQLATVKALAKRSR